MGGWRRLWAAWGPGVVVPAYAGMASAAILMVALLLALRAGPVEGQAILMVALLLALRAGPVEGQASVPCYMQQGGAKQVAGSGCEWEMQSGATLDIQSGATATIADLTVSDDLAVTDDATVGGDLTVTGSIVAASYITTGGDVDIDADVTISDSLTVGTDATVGDDATIGGDLVVSGTATVVGDLAANDLTVADFANITAQDVITVTMNGVLTPTGSLQPIAAAGAVSIDGGTNIAHVTDYLILGNIGAQTVTFTETTGLISAGNIALGAGDASTLVWADGGWIEIARSNN